MSNLRRQLYKSDTIYGTRSIIGNPGNTSNLDLSRTELTDSERAAPVRQTPVYVSKFLLENFGTEGDPPLNVVFSARVVDGRRTM